MHYVVAGEEEQCLAYLNDQELKLLKVLPKPYLELLVLYLHIDWCTRYFLSFPTVCPFSSYSDDPNES